MGTELSHETIANITDDVLEDLQQWQNRLWKEIYPDASVVKVLAGHHRMNRSAYIAVAPIRRTSSMCPHLCANHLGAGQ